MSIDACSFCQRTVMVSRAGPGLEAERRSFGDLSDGDVVTVCVACITTSQSERSRRYAERSAPDVPEGGEL